MLIGLHDQMPDFVSQDMSEEGGVHVGDPRGSKEDSVAQYRNHRDRIERTGKRQSARVCRRVLYKSDLYRQTVVQIHWPVRLPLQSNFDRRIDPGRWFRCGEQDRGGTISSPVIHNVTSAPRTLLAIRKIAHTHFILPFLPRAGRNR